MRYQEFEIEEELPKTVRVTEKGRSVRRLRKDFLKVKSDFKNDRIDKLQFYMICYEADRKKAIALLTTATQDKADELMASANHAYEALRAGTELEKID